MLFNSIEFFLFFLTVTPLYFLLPHRWRWLHLLIASCIFYCAFIPVYILILFFTIIIDYIAGIMIQNAQGKKRKMFLVMSIVANVGVLAIFKYYNFFTGNINVLLEHWQITTHPFPFLNIILPIGLSFHTFQAMSYTIEVYRGNQKAEKHFGIYSLYVMFYPQLVAGPIERPQNLLHQFHDEHKFDYENLLTGLRLMLWGLFKKVVIGDRVSAYADAIFANPDQYHALQIIVGVLCFSIHIYCDFSGYSDIAIGSARCMGFKLMTNFNRPYFATSIKEFWTKWHISLSTWFRDYVYISMGGNRKGLLKMYFNIAVVFVVSGFWHGANWTFMIWGAIHAFFNVANIMLEKTASKFTLHKFTNFKPLGWLLTFLIVSLAWIFFRAQNAETAWHLITKIFTPASSYTLFKTVKNFGSLSMGVSVIGCIYLFTIESFTTPIMDWFNNKPVKDFVFCAVTLSLIVCFGVFSQQSFIYFQF